MGISFSFSPKKGFSGTKMTLARPFGVHILRSNTVMTQLTMEMPGKFPFSTICAPELRFSQHPLGSGSAHLYKVVAKTVWGIARG